MYVFFLSGSEVESNSFLTRSEVESDLLLLASVLLFKDLALVIKSPCSPEVFTDFFTFSLWGEEKRLV